MERKSGGLGIDFSHPSNERLVDDVRQVGVYAVIAGLLIATGGLVAALRMALLTVVAHGSSMEPWLRSGETVLATRWWPKRWLWRGAVVLFKGYGGVVGFGEPWLIKRISHLPGETVCSVC